jgi:hypothetical protein
MLRETVGIANGLFPRDIARVVVEEITDLLIIKWVLPGGVWISAHTTER